MNKAVAVLGFLAATLAYGGMGFYPPSSGGGGGSGDVVGPASATNNAIAVFDGTTGKLLKNSSPTISGSTITAALSGNASTATALAANPSACASDRYVTDTAANGDLTCGQVTDSGLATSYLKADGSRALSSSWAAGQPITATTLGATANGAASTPGLSVTGTPYAAGTATTNKPQLLVEPSGATSTNWSTSGSLFGVNSASGFTGKLLDVQKNGVHALTLDVDGSSVTRMVLGTTASALKWLYFRDTDDSFYWGIRHNPSANTMGFGYNGTVYGEFQINASSKVNFVLPVAGSGINIKEGTNARMGAATLSSGAATVSTNQVTASSRIFLTIQSLGTVSVPKSIGVTARSAGTSFTITSEDNTDTSVVAWEIMEPAP